MTNLELEKKIYDTLRDGNVYGEVYQDGEEWCVEISWGDWKHDHWRCDWLMEEVGAKSTGVNITEEDGSDCYSAIHYYKF